MWVVFIALGAAGFLAWAVRGRSASVLAPSIWRIPAAGNRVALTFDDGPSESTPALLALLREHNAKATFFVCGYNAARLPEILKAIVEDGHEIGNHTWSHPRLDFASSAKMRDEIGRTQKLIEEITGSKPSLFRAPYGVRWFGLGAVQKEFGLLGVMWTAIGLDWKHPGPAVTAQLNKAATAGAILCLHDGRVLETRPDIANTLEAVRILLPLLKQRNLSITSVSAMLEP